MTDTDQEPTPITRKPRRRRAATRRRTTRSNGFTADLRSQLGEKVKPCPMCGSQGGNKSQMSRDMGISVMSLNKFLKGGRVNSDTIDAVHKYLNRSE